MTDATTEQPSGPTLPAVFRPGPAEKEMVQAALGLGVLSVIFLVFFCYVLVARPPQWRELVPLTGGLALFLAWIGYYVFRHRKDRYEVDESQIVYVGPNRRLALAWDEIDEIRECAMWLALRPKDCTASRTLRIPMLNELLPLIYSYCPAARRASGDPAELPQVLRTRWGTRVEEWVVMRVMFLSALALLFVGVLLFAAGLQEPEEFGRHLLLLMPLALLLAVLLLVVVRDSGVPKTDRPSAMEVTADGIVMHYPRRWRLGTRMLTYDEIEEIAPVHPGVVVRSRLKLYHLASPRGGCLAAYDLLLSAWHAAREANERDHPPTDAETS